MYSSIECVETEADEQLQWEAKLQALIASYMTADTATPSLMTTDAMVDNNEIRDSYAVDHSAEQNRAATPVTPRGNI